MKESITFVLGVALSYLYFGVNYFFTQAFFRKKWIWVPFVISAAILALVIVFSPPEERIRNLLIGLLFTYYSILLYLIKKKYSALNSFLIKRNRVNTGFSGKAFTYTTFHRGLFERGISWDEEVASEPSWLDHILSVCLVFLPLLLVVISLFLHALL